MGWLVVLSGVVLHIHWVFDGKIAAGLFGILPRNIARDCRLGCGGGVFLRGGVSLGSLGVRRATSGAAGCGIGKSDVDKRLGAECAVGDGGFGLQGFAHGTGDCGRGTVFVPEFLKHGGADCALDCPLPSRVDLHHKTHVHQPRHAHRGGGLDVHSGVYVQIARDVSAQFGCG